MGQQSAELTPVEEPASAMETASKDAQVVIRPGVRAGREASIEGEGGGEAVAPTGNASAIPDNNGADMGADLGATRQRIRRRSKANHDAEALRHSFFAEPSAEGDGYSSVEPGQVQPSINSQGSAVLHRPVAVRPVAVRPAPILPFVGQQPHRHQQPLNLQQPIIHAPSSNTSHTNVNRNNWSNVPRQNNITGGRRAMKSAKSLARKYKKPSWYHSVAAQNRLGSIHEDAFLPESDDEADDYNNETREQEASPSLGMQSISGQHPHHQQQQQQIQAKQELLRALNRTGGDANTPAFQLALQKLLLRYDPSHFDPRKPVPRYAQAVAANQLEGVGIAAGKPAFPGCIGRNGRGKDGGDPMYKLGTMSFGAFSLSIMIECHFTSDQ